MGQLKENQVKENQVKENPISFSSLGLSAPILKAVAEQGYETPSPIQAKAIPLLIMGKDVMVAARTGTGKTLVFTLPILERLSKKTGAGANQVRSLILVPTRELALQIGESVVSCGRHLPLSSTVVFGGVKINPQMMKLRKGVDLLVATPGRLLDLYGKNAVKFRNLEIVVLDEADRMLEMGFIDDIQKILALLPSQRQTIMLSATFSEEIRTLARTMLQNPLEISITLPNTPVETIEQWIYPVDKNQKSPLLARLIMENKWHQVLVFTGSKNSAERLAHYLERKGIKASAIHGNKSQGSRTRTLAEFKDGKIEVLVATDLASRGLDIDKLPHVINFDLPRVKEDYIHRIGRTGRANARGCAISLVSNDEFQLLADIERLIKTVLTRKLIHGFEPVEALQKSCLDLRPFPQKKSKKPKKRNLVS